jgi:CrcB protein
MGAAVCGAEAAALRPALPTLDRRELAAVFSGGCLGALLRYGLGEALVSDPGSWPWATFVANVGGAFLLGYFATRLQERLPLSAYGRPFLASGLCGALTTFSTMQLELLWMLDRSEFTLAAGYIAASLTGGFAALVLATKLVRRVPVSS